MKLTSQPMKTRCALIPALLLAGLAILFQAVQVEAANTGKAILIRSAGQYFSAPDSPSLSVTGDLTIEAWVKLSSQPSSGSYTIVSKSTEGGNQASFGLRYLDVSGVKQLDAWISSNGAGVPHATVTYTIATGQWTHIAMVYSSAAGAITFYVNGSQAGTTQSGLPNSIFDGNAPLLISGYDVGHPTTLLDGQIDDVRLWATARTEQQIRIAMFSELLGTELNLRGYWKLNNSPADSTPNSNTLANNNNVVFQSDDRPFFTSAQQLEFCPDTDVRGLWHFEGVDDVSGNGYTLNNYNGVTFTNAKLFKAADFGAGNNNKSLSVASDLAIQSTSKQSYACWFSISAQPTTGNGYYIFFKDVAGAGQGNLRLQYDNSGGVSFLRFARGSSTFLNLASHPVVLVPGFNYFAVGTYDGSTLRLYLNGILVATQASTDTSGSGASTEFSVGIRKSDGTLPFSGRVDELMVSARVISNEEILKYYGGIVTARFTALPGDGAVVNIGGTTWATMRNGAVGNFVYGGDTSTQGGIAGNRGNSAADFVERGFFPFNSAALPDGGIQLSRAALNVHVPGGPPTCPFFITPQMQASVNALTVSDFSAVTLNDSPLLSSLQSAVTPNSANNFELNPTGLAYISTSGFTKLGTRSTFDINNNGEGQPEVNTAATFSESPTNKPYLLVEYHALPGLLHSISGTISGINLPAGIIQVRAGSESSPATSVVGLTALGAYTIPALLGGEIYNVTAFIDANANQIRDPLEWGGEYSGNPLMLDGDKVDIDITIAAPVDLDNDGMPDAWETANGLVVGLNDAGLDLDDDGLVNAHELSVGTRANHSDSDYDELGDGDEVKLWGTNPLKADTDGDGIPDGWEVLSGLNPLVSNANEDADFDGISNFQEYQYSQTHTNSPLNPRNGYSGGFGVSDYEVFTGGQSTNRIFYDRNDRLVGEEFSRGVSLGYVYDGNGNLVRQKWLSRAAETNGLPALWRFLNGLTNSTSPYFDTDGDGWTDYQEWKAGTSPLNSTNTPNALGNPGTNIASLVLPFTPSNFVVGVGQLDGVGAEEIVLGADGNPGTNVNWLLVLTQTFSGWQTQRVDVGTFGITSIAVGQVTNRPSTGIYVGLRGTTNGSGRVMEFTKSSGIWQSNVVALSTNQAAFVLGVRGQDVLVSLANMNLADGSLSAVSFTTNWNLSLMDTNTSHRGLGTVFNLDRTNRTALRLSDSGYVQWGMMRPAGLPVNAIYWAGAGAWYLLLTNTFSWSAAESIAQTYGGHLASINSQAENDWIFSAFSGTAFPEPWIGISYQASAGKFQWSSSESVVYTNWAAGEPNTQGFGYIYLYPNTGTWGEQESDLSAHSSSLVKVAVGPALGSFPEPPAFNRRVWRGSSLEGGFSRGTNSSSIFYTVVDDKDGNALVNFGDEFIVAEYLVSGTNASLLTLSRQPIASLAPAQSYGLASVNFLNASNEIFFTGEPDGQVFAWTATGTTNPLQRQLFSAHHAGKAWHALAGIKTLETGESLIGLRVDPTNQTRCDVILWSPQTTLPQTTVIVQTAPAAAVLPQTNVLGSLAAVSIRLWDAEGNAASPFLQYQLSGTTNWQPATLTTLDGQSYNPATRVATSPSGVNHAIVWNALANIGAGVVTNVSLRARASDMTLLGDWSAPTPFQLNTTLADNDGMDDSWELFYFGVTSRTGSGDFDGDGFTDYQEYIADTNPTDANSNLRFTAIIPLVNGVKIDWLGGTNATQYLQRALFLNTGGTWSNLVTNLPPTPITGSYTDTLGTNAMKFYRIKVTR